MNCGKITDYLTDEQKQARNDILSVRDAAERQRRIAQSLELFDVNLARSRHAEQSEQ